MTLEDRRRMKYPDTSTFHYYNANPCNKITTDCVIRAIATGTGIPYKKVLMDLAELQCKTGYDMSEHSCYGRYLESLGWIKYKQPRKKDNTKYTGKEFCKQLQNKGIHNSIIAHIGGHHLVAICDGKVVDTWNSTDGCIGRYWMSPLVPMAGLHW